jgi:hypothetical protein
MSTAPQKDHYGQPSEQSSEAPEAAAADAWDNPGWKEAARQYHETRGNRPPIVETEPERLARLRRLLADNISLDRAWGELNQHQRVDAPQTTVEALMFSLRRGVGALADEPATQRRLSELSEEQVCEVYARVQKFKPRIAPAWSEPDADVLLVLWRDLGQDD